MDEEKTLHGMENQVTKGAKSADPMPGTKLRPRRRYSWSRWSYSHNSKSTDDSNKLKTPSLSLPNRASTDKGSAEQQHPGHAAITSTGYGRGTNEEVEQEEEVENVIQEEEIDLSQDVQALLEGETLMSSKQSNYRFRGSCKIQNRRSKRGDVCSVR